MLLSCWMHSIRRFIKDALHKISSIILSLGKQYLAIRYSERLEDANITPSVGSVGDSYDNALAETINGLYKAEVIHRLGPWQSMESVEFETLKWVDWFNNRRLLKPIGHIPPAEAEANYYNSLDRKKCAA